MTHVINRGTKIGGHPIADATARAKEAQDCLVISETTFTKGGKTIVFQEMEVKPEPKRAPKAKKKVLKKAKK